VNTRQWINGQFVWKIAAIIASAVLLVSCTVDDSDNPSSSPKPATFTNLGFLPGDTSSMANAVSSDGAVIVGSSISPAGISHAFRWNAQQKMVGLGLLPGGNHATAASVSANGSVVVGYGDSSSAPPSPSAIFRWTVDNGIARVDGVPGSYLCTASGVSGDGSALVGTCLTFNSEAYRWTESTGSVGLGRFGGGSDQTSSAAALSSDGRVVVGAGHPTLTGAVLWVFGGGSIVLGRLPGDAFATASAVSKDGAVVVGSSTDNSQRSRAFRWTQQTGMVALPDAPGGTSGMASGVSGDGQLIVGSTTSAAGEAAAIWDAEHGTRLLETVLSSEFPTDLKGWKLIRATAISDDGRTIVGYGTNPGGQTEGWILQLPD
jgi:probable HAF family extracellular repeat protein